MTDRHAKSDIKLEIHKRVAFEDLHWDCVQERLVVRTKGTGLAVDLLIKQFRFQFFGWLKARWLGASDLAQGDNLVVAALCECHGCDEITIERSFRIFAGLGSVPVFQALSFRARSKSPAGIAAETPALLASLESGLVKVGPRAFPFIIRSYRMLVLFSAFCVLLVSLFYALAAILVIYAGAVFMQFLSDPGGVTILATQKAEIAIALLSFMVGLAALFGRVVKRMFRIIRPNP